MNPSVLSKAMSKEKGQIGFYSLGKAISLEGKHWIQTSFTLLKNLTLCHILLMVEES